MQPNAPGERRPAGTDTPMNKKPPLWAVRGGRWWGCGGVWRGRAVYPRARVADGGDLGGGPRVELVHAPTDDLPPVGIEAKPAWVSALVEQVRDHATREDLELTHLQGWEQLDLPIVTVSALLDGIDPDALRELAGLLTEQGLTVRVNAGSR